MTDSLKNNDGLADLSAKDLCAILKACQQSGVSCFRFRDLVVEFRKETAQVTGAEVSEILFRAPVVSSSDHVQPTERAGGPDEKPDYLDVLMIEDPAGYEKYLLDRAHQGEDA